MSAYDDTAEPTHDSVRHIVTAVVVAHDGDRWLGELIAGLRQQRRRPDRVVVVDTGSTDNSRDLVARAFGPQIILDAPRSTGFGGAVRKANQALPRPDPETVEWLWLLHDDCAPTPGALHELLDLAIRTSTSIVGPKLRSWPRGRQLLELGVTITGSGNRETGLEYAEFDQGQHDSVRDVLAVSTAGMLVRRDVYEKLRGFDPRLKLFRDDLDFCWRAHRSGHRVRTCPDAIVFHAEAAHRGARRAHAVPGRPRRADRTHAIYTLLVNCAWWAVPLIGIRMVMGALLRTLALLVAKWPDAAYDEFRALLTTVCRPDLVLRGRLRRRGRRPVSLRRMRPLFPPPWIGIQHTVDALAAVISTRSGTHTGPSKRRRQAVETGPVSEEAEELDDESSGLLRWFFTRPPVLLVLGLLLVTLIAGRSLIGGGLGGGALLLAPDSAFDLWGRYLEAWHPVELGGGAAAPPYIAVIAALGTLMFGSAGVAVYLLLLGSVPLAAITGYLFTQRIARSRAVRLWAAGTYALLPAVTGAIAAGRIGTCAAIVLLPLLGIAGHRMVRVARTPGGSWSSTWTTGLLLAIVVAFVPLGYGFALVLGLVAIAAFSQRARLAGRIGVVLAVPPLLLAPWLPTLVENPWLLVGEAGRSVPYLADAALPPYVLAFASPGGPGGAPFWILVPLGLAALAALLRRDRTPGVAAAWVIALSGLAVGLLQSRLLVRAEWIADPAPAWPGLAAVLVAAGWIVALAHAADGAIRVISQSSFSWRQPSAGLLLVVCTLTSTVAGGWWLVRGADGPVDRQPEALPAYVTTAMENGVRPRALVFRRSGDEIRYALLRDSGAHLGDVESGSSLSSMRGVDGAVSKLLGDSDRDQGALRLAQHGVGYIYIAAPADRRMSELLDTTPGLARSSADRGAAAWKLEAPAARLRLLPEGEPDPVGAKPLRSDAIGVDTELPSGSPAGTLILAENYDDGWTATLDGEPLTPIEHGNWAQAFELPADAAEQGGDLEIRYDNPLHLRLLTLQGALLVVVIVLSLPARQRRDRGVEYADAGKHGATELFAEDPGPVRRPDDAQPTRRTPEEVQS